MALLSMRGSGVLVQYLRWAVLGSRDSPAGLPRTAVNKQTSHQEVDRHGEGLVPRNHALNN